MTDSNDFAWSIKKDLEMMLSTLGTVALWKDDGEKDKEYQKLGNRKTVLTFLHFSINCDIFLISQYVTF